MKYDWILFDADNTLLDFTGASKIAFAKALEKLEIPANPTHFATYKVVNHIVWTELEKGIIDAITLRKKRFDLFLKEIKVERDPSLFNQLYLDNLVEYSQLLPGAEELLTHLHGKTKLALITNGLKEVQRPRFAHTDIARFFDVIVVSDEIGVAKPHAGYFDYVFNEMNQSSKEKIIVIGDNINSDIKGGVDYGLDTCWYNPERQTNDSGIQPTYVAHDFKEMLTYLSFGTKV